MKKRKMYIKSKMCKDIVLVIVYLIIIFFICSSLTLMDRRYFFIEKIFKNLNGYLNNFITNKTYNINYDYSEIINKKIDVLKKENNDLLKILNFKETNENYIPSIVINHNITNWFEKIEIYTKNYNFKKGSAVITNDGLIGFISKNSKNISEVNLLTAINKNNRFPVLIKSKDSYVSGILSEYNVKKNLFKVTDIISKDEVSIGNEVLLAEYDNQSYKGLKVGNVTKETIDEYGISRTIWVRSSANFDDLMLVTVVGEK